MDNEMFCKDAEGVLRAKVAPQSLEGWVTARIRLAEALDERRTRLSTQIIPQALPGQVAASPIPGHLAQQKLTSEESLAVAKLLIKMRREEIEQELIDNPQPGPTEEAPKKKKPPPEVET